MRLGGPKPEQFRVVALRGAPDADAGALAARLRGLDVDIAFLAAPVDSAWFARLAGASGLVLSGPASAGDLRIAFLAWEAVGDTTVSLPLEGGGALTVQDALYEVDDDRFLDLMSVHLPAGVAPRAAARALLAYVATDVMGSVGVLLAVSAERPADGDELAELLAPVFAPESRCETAEPGLRGSVRLLHGPPLRIHCASIRGIPEETGAVLADIVVPR
ncbi:MAG TPA: hypothetical protein VMK65_14030 [Longimicrobiales bacterium]|nr:hypothetical protein [Longimicrobiales bacterium]